MSRSRILVTGFEPYGGRSLNPAHEVMNQLNGRKVAGCQVVGHALPVAIEGLEGRIVDLLHDVNPDVVISLGLWPGESLIRIERVALNVMDFAIADNAGKRPLNQPVRPEGATALMATIPVRAIETALLAANIPAQVSNTAGTYLCNACLYRFLESASRLDRPVQCGFLHLPYLPQQVANLLASRREDASVELHQQKELASMSLELQVEAVELVIATSHNQA